MPKASPSRWECRYAVDGDVLSDPPRRVRCIVEFPSLVALIPRLEKFLREVDGIDVTDPAQASHRWMVVTELGCARMLAVEHFRAAGLGFRDEVPRYRSKLPPRAPDAAGPDFRLWVTPGGKPDRPPVETWMAIPPRGLMA